MGIKKCCIAKCKSKSTRKEDVRVTYHKFPKDVSVRDTWVRVTRQSYDVERSKYVCSRHFLLIDFEHSQGRYVLKSGAVPKIFPWTKMDELDLLTTIEHNEKDKRNLSTSSIESEPENLEAIKNFIAKHDNKEPTEHEKIPNESEKKDDIKMEIDENAADPSIQSDRVEPLTIASSVMDLSFYESTDILPKNYDSASNSPTIEKKKKPVQLNVGAKVQVNDFAESWYSAEVVEVDYEDNEVFVCYDSISKKPGEWIKVSSSRLRPVVGKVGLVDVGCELSITDEKNYIVKQSKMNTTETTEPVKEEEKEVDKPKPMFAVGEKCLARWRDNRRFVATIETELGDGTYGIIFDDGFHWKCSANRLSKLKSSSKTDSSADSRACSTPSPTPGTGPSTSAAINPMPVFHKHLFDPTRDYLGSKSERREQKRKLNIKEIFNIGQKQRRKEAPVKEEKPKIPKEKKPRVKKNIKVEPKTDVEIKDIPDAIASIIGTVSNDGEKDSTKKESEDIKHKKEKTKLIKKHKKSQPAGNKTSETKKNQFQTSDNREKILDDDATHLESMRNNKEEKSFAPNVLDEDTHSEKLSDSEFDTFDDHDVNTSGDQDEKLSDDPDGKMSLDKIQEEDKLQNFEKPDDVVHERVMDRIKEAINKLEDGLNRELNAGSPKLNRELHVSLPKLNTELIGSPKLNRELHVSSPKLNRELHVSSPKLNRELNVGSPKLNRELHVSSPKLNRELNVGSPKLNRELHVSSPKLNRELNVGSPKLNRELNVNSPKANTDSPKEEIEYTTGPKVELNTIVSKLNIEFNVDSPEVNTEFKVDSPSENIEPNVESPKVTAELDMDQSEVKTEPNADLNKVEIPLDTGSVKIETVKEDPEKPIEEVEIKEDPSTGTVKKSKKKKKILMKLARRIKILREDDKTESIVEINSKLENIKKEMKEILLMFKKGKAPGRTKLLEGEWCCKWVNGEPVGTVVDTEPDNRIDVLNKIALPRKTMQVEDKRLPEGWTKLMVRRSFGHSAGKWDVVLVSPDKRRFHTKTDIRNYLENNPDPSLKAYEPVLIDFAVHLKLARRLGWVAGDSGHASRNLVNRPLAKKRKKLMVKLGDKERKVKKRKLSAGGRYKYEHAPVPGTSDSSMLDSSGNISFNNSTLEDGYVYVGSLKVQVIDNLLRCPAEACFKNFRNSTLLQMHIKHYHREMRKSLGATPKVLDLAYARTMPTETESRRHEPDNKIIKVKIPRPPKRIEEKLNMKEINIDPRGETLSPPHVKTPRSMLPKIPRSLDSPMMRQYALQTTNRPKTVKRPKVLLPVRRPEPVQPPPEMETMDELPDFSFDSNHIEPRVPVPPLPTLDFETAISTHTVSKPLEMRRRPEKRKVFATISKAPLSEDEEMGGVMSDLDTRSSFPGSGTPDSKTMEPRAVAQNIPMSSESNEDIATYMYTETGEKIKLERMKREEIINCHCGFREEDGLMVQCELCLCWQHALCHNIQREADVPQKYTCSICLSPRRARRSQRFLHDQDRMGEGVLPGAPASQPLRRSHRVSAHLLHVADALHALRVKYYVATKKNHPKLYLWAKDWDAPEAAFAPDKPNPYSDLSVIINGVTSKGGRPRPDESARGDVTPTDDAEERFSQNGSLSNHSLLGGLLASPGGPSLEMPISTSELERLAKSVQEQSEPRPAVRAPQPEAAIENGACRERLLRHVQRCQALIDARLDTLEAEIIELESQEPSFEDDETADYFPRTKQTVRMLLRDLSSLQELGLIT